MNEVVKRLEAWLAANNPSVLEGMRPGLSDAEIDKHEAQLGWKLPDGMRALYRWRNGNKDDSFASIMDNRKLMPLETALEDREMMNGHVDAGEFESEDYWHEAWLPFLHNGATSYLCYDHAGSFGGKRGQVLEFWNGDVDRNIVAPSFDAWLTTFVESLEAGMWKRDDDGAVSAEPGCEAFWEEKLPGYPIAAVEDDD